MDVSENLTKAFKEMRKAGLIARQNFLCCSGCAEYQIATDLETIIDKDTKKKNTIKGCCFYHHQDAERKNKKDNFQLRYGPVVTTKHGEVGLSTKSVGNLICSILSKHAVPFQWDGNPNRCIEIIQKEAA